MHLCIWILFYIKLVVLAYINLNENASQMVARLLNSFNYK